MTEILITNCTEDAKANMLHDRKNDLERGMEAIIRNGFTSELTSDGCEAWIGLAKMSGFYMLAEQLRKDLDIQISIQE